MPKTKTDDSRPSPAELRERYSVPDGDEVFVRDMRLHEDPDEDSRTLDLSFSSEEPVARFFGEEVLDHRRGSVRLGRLNDGAPLLFNHHPDRYVGVVEQARISERRGGAVVRFGESDLGNELFRAVRAGEITKVSVGYVVHQMERETAGGNGPDRWRVTDWEPLEISLVTIPADPTVGTDRSAEQVARFVRSKATQSQTEGNTMPDEIQGNEPTSQAPEQRSAPAAPAPAPAPVVNVNHEREDAVRIERERIANIEAVASRHPQLAELAAQARTNGTSAQDFNALALERLSQSPEYTPPDNPNELGLSSREQRSYSFLRAIRAMANPGNRALQDAAGFERECSEEIASKRGATAKGMFVPSTRGTGLTGYNLERAMNFSRGGFQVPADVQRMATRDLSAGTATDGDELVATDLLAGSFIDVLRNSTVVMQAGARMLTDLVGDVAIPRKTSGAAGGWIATEGGAASQSDPQFDQVSLVPKTCGVYTEYTRQLTLQSSLDIESLVRDDLARGLAITIDLAALHGSGASGQPTGVENTTGINNPTSFAAVNPTFAEVIDMETQVAVDNALMGTLSYILTAAMRGALKSTLKDSGSGQFVYEGGLLGEMNGYPAWTSNQVTAGDLFFGNWADLLIGMWGGLDLLVDPYSNSTSGTIRVVAFQSVDVAVRHAVSFAHNNDGV